MTVTLYIPRRTEIDGVSITLLTNEILDALVDDYEIPSSLVRCEHVRVTGSFDVMVRGNDIVTHEDSDDLYTDSSLSICLRGAMEQALAEHDVHGWVAA